MPFQNKDYLLRGQKRAANDAAMREESEKPKNPEEWQKYSKEEFAKSGEPSSQQDTWDQRDAPGRQQQIEMWGNTNRVLREFKYKSQFFHHWRTLNDAHCCVKMYRDDKFAEVYGDPGTDIKFEIGGGSDVPHFALRLTHKERYVILSHDHISAMLTLNPCSRQTATFYWLASSHRQPADAAFREASKYPQKPSPGPHTFAESLQKVMWKETEYPPQVLSRRNWQETEGSYALLVQWETATNPIGLCTELNTEAMTDESRVTLKSFKCLRQATLIRVLVRGHRGLEETWKFFCSQPVPTPPAWWRYTKSTHTPNEARVEPTEPIRKFSPIWYHHVERRNRDFDRIHPQGNIISMNEFTQFMDNTHYEVFSTLSLERELQAQESLYDASYNQKYKYELSPIGIADQSLDSASDFFIELSVSPRNHDEATLPPSVKTRVTIRCQFEEYSGSVVSSDGPKLWIEVKRVRGSGPIILNDREDFIKIRYH